ncbi:hypothetical protein N7533_001744 [Penicillium manginii]|uniref:uncharacterized protein n=1 Tax=Penicillium manginii TaxID=203109 RepID=UPI0025470978|nr:uncharacterized protein N7533_001744 [Penicillium manginii]KAJ5763063.1 hypothetical protein N7533_001744 [Penicillium manginii]
MDSYESYTSKLYALWHGSVTEGFELAESREPNLFSHQIIVALSTKDLTQADTVGHMELVTWQSGRR